MTNNKTSITIGNNLRIARRKSGLTQLQVADAVDINVNYYAKLERGEAIPSIMTLKRILEVIKTKSSRILPF